MPDTRPNALGRALHGFLADDLPRTRGLSRHTVLSYRDSLKLFLQFLAVRHSRPATALDFSDLAPEHLELCQWIPVNLTVPCSALAVRLDQRQRRQAGLGCKRTRRIRLWANTADWT